MIMKKRHSKGSFLSFFDWNEKSQKKRFCDNPNLPDVSNQAKENMKIMPMSQIDENGEKTTNIASSDEECGTNKSIGLVARLMGLDSLPDVPTVSLETSQFHEIVLHSKPDYCNVDPTNTALKSNKSFSGAIESSTMKKFQNETLHLRSAKPISVTCNKLLSPIKCHGYTQSKNVSYIKAEDVKNIEVSPRPYTRNRMSSVGSLSVPLRTLDPEEKLKVAPRGSKLNVNGKPTVRSSNLYKSSPTVIGSRDSENNNLRRGKGKSDSLVTPSKTNVQSRDMLNLNGNRRYMKQKNCHGENINVLRQNGVTSKGKSTSKVDTNKPTQTRSSESSAGARKTTNKCAVNSNIESKRSSTRVTDKQKEFSVSKRKSSSQKKRYDQNDARCSYESKSIKCNVTIDESLHQDAFSMKESRDVISFTFTSPLRKKMSESRSTIEQAMKTRTIIDVDSFDHSDKVYPKKLSLSHTKLNVIDVDALSVMLSHINPPQCTSEIEGCSVGFKPISEDRFNSMVCNSSREHGNSFHLYNMDDNCCSSSDNMVLNMNQQLQILPTEYPRCSSNSESGNGSCYQHTRTLTTFHENHFTSKTYLDCEDSTHGGSTVYSSMQDEEVSSSQINESISPNYKKNWSKKSSTRMMELEYVKDILSNAELMEEELMVGETNNIIMPTLFELLENKKTGVKSYEEYSKLERKAIFDCVREFLELRCRQVFVSWYKAWPRYVESVSMRKRCLAEEVYKDMLEIRSMEEDVVVDEIVSKDMNTPLGRWLDFDIEVSENGLELELDIVTYLIDELVYDLWLV
ncbi:uncharacterized protein LOC123891334 isoform X1 [Trifolium pratense]|uniref:uncharacterized protein LOC123891334 isoform X1 n=1 Tax=Trifolium pratense TaxID=57577 RepID=UPI001E691ED2|nr:uncharacterized protein LOC123891334 isoform X1 [Trifolium pratense]